MYMLLNWFPNGKWMQAICWTLLHSLWQGMLLAIVAAIIVMVTRRSLPRLRYSLLTALFVVFIIVTGITFIKQFMFAGEEQSSPVRLEMAIPVSTTGALKQTAIQATSARQTYLDAMVEYFNTHASIIVITWFIFFSAKLVRILANIGYVQRIRNYRTSAPPYYWKQKMTELAQKLGISQSILLLESTIIKVPMVVGMLKPVILVPLGLLANLPPAQVEAVLLHELAHIRRKDYLVNLLQSFAEVLFFFNPAVLWISSLIREEREYCCDDVAIGRIDNKKQFIQALVSFQEYAMSQPGTSTIVAFAGRKKYLLNRVKRIIHNENKKLNAMEKGFIIFSIVGISLVGFVSMKQIPAKKTSLPISVVSGTKAQGDLLARNTDTIPATLEFETTSSTITRNGDGETRIVTATDKNGKKYKLVEKNDEPKQLYVNDQKIPSEKMDEYEKLVVEMELSAKSRQNKDVEKMKKDRDESTEKMLKLEAERRELTERLEVIEKQQADLGHNELGELEDHEWENAATLKKLELQQLKMRKEGMKDQDLANLFYYKLDKPRKDMNDRDLAPLFYYKQDLLRKEMNENDLLKQKLFDEKAETLYNKSFDLKYEPNLDNGEQLSKEGIFEQQHSFMIIDPIINDMVEEGLLPPHQEEMSFELNNGRFTINGKKQPADVHERYRKKYLKKDGDYFKFSRKNGSTSTSIKQE